MAFCKSSFHGTQLYFRNDIRNCPLVCQKLCFCENYQIETVLRSLFTTSVIPKFMKFSQGTLALINNLTMPRGAYFQIFKEIIPNSKFAVIIWFWHFLANIFQFLALRITLSKIFFNKSYFKLHFRVCANVLLLLEVDLTLWIFIWKHSTGHHSYVTNTTAYQNGRTT